MVRDFQTLPILVGVEIGLQKQHLDHSHSRATQQHRALHGSDAMTRHGHYTHPAGQHDAQLLQAACRQARQHRYLQPVGISQRLGAKSSCSAEHVNAGSRLSNASTRCHVSGNVEPTPLITTSCLYLRSRRPGAQNQAIAYTLSQVNRSLSVTRSKVIQDSRGCRSFAHVAETVI
jgi:hypothetical protein